jgi:hypothetical protein
LAQSELGLVAELVGQAVEWVEEAGREVALAQTAVEVVGTGAQVQVAAQVGI